MSFLSQTNSSIQSSLAPEIITLESTKNSNELLDKHRKSGKPADRKKFLDLKYLFRKSIKLSHQSYLEDILDVVSNDLTSNPNRKKQTLYTSQHSKQDSASVAPLRKHNSVHHDDPTKTTIRNEQFQSVFSRKSPNSLSSFCHMKRKESTDADRHARHYSHIQRY